MATVEFVADEIVAETESETPLVQVAQENGSSIPFGCTNGVCGTCVISVLSGHDNLSAPTAIEKQTLEMFGADDGDHRLACQCIIEGDVRLDNP